MYDILSFPISFANRCKLKIYLERRGKLMNIKLTLKYLVAMRPASGIFSFIIVLISFKGINFSLNQIISVALTEMVIVSYVMAQNDLDDYETDLLKGKDFVKNNKLAFSQFVLILRLIALFFAVSLVFANVNFALLALFHLFVGAYYSKTRHLPIINNLAVAITAASSSIFPLMVGHFSKTSLAITISVFLIIFAREIIKDIEDLGHDLNKITIPILLEKHTSIVIASVLIIIALGILTPLLQASQIILSAGLSVLIILAAIFVLISIFTANIHSKTYTLDLGVAIFLVTWI